MTADSCLPHRCGLVVMPPGHAIKLNSPVEFESMYEIVKDVKSTAASYANFSIEVAMRYDFKPLPTLNVWKVYRYSCPCARAEPSRHSHGATPSTPTAQ
jgi:hypothetical protein